MITAEERREIINAVKEEILLDLPGITGQLMINRLAAVKVNEKFYSDHPEFKDHKDLVASVAENIEGLNTLEDYDTILKKAVPEIRKKLATMKRLDTTNVSQFRPNLGDL